MSRAQVWKRLWWKEFREDWLVVLAAAAAPLVLYSLATHWRSGGPESPVFWPAWLIMQAIIVLWAAGKARSNRQGLESFEARLPADPLQEWIVSFAAPAIVAACLGGLFSISLLDSMQNFTWSFALIWALDTATTFALCYLLSATVSYWGSVTVGIARSVAAGLVSAGSMYQALASTDAVVFIVRTAIGAAAGSFVFAVLARRRPIAFRQVTALFVAIGVIYVPYLKTAFSPESAWWRDGKLRAGLFDFGSAAEQPDLYETPTHAECGPQGCRPTVTAFVLHVGRGVSRVQYKYLRGRTVVSGTFKEPVRIAGVLQDGRVYLAQQLAQTEIILWDAKSNRTTHLASLSLGRGALRRFKMGPVSPDNRHMVMLSKSKVGLGSDIWVADLRKGAAFVALDNCDCVYSNAGWGNGKAFLSGEGNTVVVDLKTMKGRVFRF